MRLSAFDCLRRGWTNLSANWELVVIQWLESFLVLVLLAVGLLVPLVILGTNVLNGIDDVLRRLADFSPALAMSLTAMLAVWLLALLLHCYFQAGAFGVLASADRQALPGPRRDPRLFRTFSLRDFFGWGGRYVWRFLGLRVLFWGLALLVAGAVLFWLVFLGLGGVEWGGAAAFGIGCGGALPIGFLALVLGLGFHVAQADLARDGSGVRPAFRRGLDVLGRRLGAVLALFVAALGAALALAAVFLPLSAVIGSLLSGAPRWRALVQLILFFLQALPNTLLAMVLAGSLVALVRSEMLSEIRRKPEVQTA
ncbi:MAG TPA: hypothetical protein VKK31_20825 [Thermoanaerobaculia bacterium]|nr:hypothetical protein [Thermoanaerobaculia bacterium]